jgi:hypothetical protein
VHLKLTILQPKVKSIRNSLLGLSNFYFFGLRKGKISKARIHYNLYSGFFILITEHFSALFIQFYLKVIFKKISRSPHMEISISSDICKSTKVT